MPNKLEKVYLAWMECRLVELLLSREGVRANFTHFHLHKIHIQPSAHAVASSGHPLIKVSKVLGFRLHPDEVWLLSVPLFKVGVVGVFHEFRQSLTVRPMLSKLREVSQGTDIGTNGLASSASLPKIHG